MIKSVYSFRGTSSVRRTRITSTPDEVQNTREPFDDKLSELSQPPAEKKTMHFKLRKGQDQFCWNLLYNFKDNLV